MRTTPLPSVPRALAAVILLVGLAVTARPEPARAQSFQTLPNPVTIGLPRAPVSDDTFGAALNAAIAAARSGRQVRFTTDAVADIVIDAQRPLPGQVGGPGVRDDDPDVTLAEMGIDPAEVPIAARGEWRIPISMRDMPSDRRPTALNLDIVAAQTAGDPAPVAHAYLNDILIGSQRLRDRSGAQRIDFALPAYLIGMDNEARIVLQRCASECDGVYPARILATSTVATERMARATTRFSDLPPRFADGINLYVGEDILARPTDALPFLTALLAEVLPKRIVAMEVIAAKAPIAVAESKPFIVVGPATGVTMPISPETGATAAVDARGRPIVDLTGTSGNVIVQIARAGTTPCLAIGTLPSGGFSPSITDLGIGDLAVFDRSGLILTLDSTNDRAIRVAYPPTERWLQHMDAYRYTALAIGWLAITLLFVYLLKKVYQHRRRG